MSAIEQLRAVLETCDGPVTRAWLESKCNERAPKRAKAAGAVAPTDHTPTDSTSAASRNPGAPVAAEGNAATPHIPTVTSAETLIKASAIIVFPHGKDLSRLLKQTNTRGGEPYCESFGPETVTDDVIVVIIAPVSAVLRLQEKLGCWGVDRVLRLFLRALPSEPNILNADCIAVCGRARSRFTEELNGWSDHIDVVQLVQGLLCEINGRKIHLFAEAETPGWDCCVGEANWRFEFDR